MIDQLHALAALMTFRLVEPKQQHSKPFGSYQDREEPHLY